MTDTPAQPLRLDDHHRLVLVALAEAGALRTGAVAERAGFFEGPGVERRRIASANCRRWLIELEAAGLVSRLEDADPVAWLRTPAGTAMLGLLL